MTFFKFKFTKHKILGRQIIFLKNFYSLNELSIRFQIMSNVNIIPSHFLFILFISCFYTIDVNVEDYLAKSFCQSKLNRKNHNGANILGGKNVAYRKNEAFFIKLEMIKN